jgi:hypothetical protein
VDAWRTLLSGIIVKSPWPPSLEHPELALREITISCGLLGYVGEPYKIFTASASAVLTVGDGPRSAPQTLHLFQIGMPRSVLTLLLTLFAGECS